jgi:outer membrane protein assembly factor BamB
MKMLKLLLISVSLGSTSLRAGDAPGDKLDNWHQWRGPLANGVAPHGKPPLKWDAMTNVKWKVPLPGRGSATPIVWKDQIFVLTAIDTGRAADPSALPKPVPGLKKMTKPPTSLHQFVVLCFDRNTGKRIWQQIAAEQVPHEGHHPTHSYVGASPTTDGHYLYVSFGSRGIYCYDLAGKLQWQRDLGLMQTRLGWGEGISPVVHGDTLIMNWDQEVGSFIVALDARTGKTRWQMDRDELTGWSTPTLVEHNGRTQVIVNATKRVRSYDLATGKLIWECGGQTANAIPSPVVRDGVVYCVSGYTGTSAMALPLDATGDITDTAKIIWRHSGGTPYVPSPLLYGDRLYFTQSNNAILTSLDIKTGKPVIDRVRLPGINSVYASPVAAADRLYFVGRDGTTLVLKHSDKLEVLASNRLDDPIDASPAVVGKQLFLRGEKNLYCIEE